MNDGLAHTRLGKYKHPKRSCLKMGGPQDWCFSRINSWGTFPSDPVEATCGQFGGMNTEPQAEPFLGQSSDEKSNTL